MDRRNALFVALGLVLVGIVAVLVAVAVRGDDDEDVEAGGETTTTTTDPATTTTTTEATTTTTPDGSAAIVAVDGGGRLVVLDPEDGEVERVLLEGIRVDDPAENAVAVAPGRGEVYVARPGPGSAPTEVVRVALDGSATEPLGEGVAPSVSPDGSQLAYVQLVEREEVVPAPVLTIRDLDTGQERQLARERESDFHFIPETAWVGGGEQIAFVAGEIFTGLYLVDADATSLDEAERVGPVARGEGTSWSAVTAFGDDALAVVERCCDVRGAERWFVVAVDLDQREVEGGLLPSDRVEAARLDSPAGETRLVYVVDLRPGGGTLHRWDGSGEPVEVAEGIVAAAW